MDHVFNAKDLCSTCGCSRKAVEHFGWTCQVRHKMAEEDYQAVQEKVEEPPVAVEDIEVEEIRVLLSKLPEPDFWLLSCLDTGKAKGHVVWEYRTPTGVQWQTHKFTFLDAVQTAFRFLYTDCWDEWLVCGPLALAVVRTLPQFVEDPKRPESGAKINYVGKLNRMDVYAYPTIENGNHFWCGRADQAVLCTIAAE